MGGFRRAFEDIGEYFRDQVGMQFELRGLSPGIRGPWKRLSPVTIRNRGGSSTQLVHHHSLMNSYVNTNDPFNINRVGLYVAAFGSRYRGLSNTGKLVPIAKFHQEGTKHMPARPVVLGNKFLDEEIIDAVVDQIFSGWKKR